MRQWIPESASASTSVDARLRTAYLQDLLDVVRARAAAYFAAEPDGEQVLLDCLDAVGRSTLDARRGGRALGTIKQDFALLVTQVLVDAHGAARVQTLRRADGRASTTPNPRAGLAWVYSYAPQRVIAA